MASSSSALSLYLPKCSICFSDARTSSHYLVQLSCYHFFCNYCVADVQQEGYYYCPFDRTPSADYTFNNQVHERTNWLLTIWPKLSDPQVQGQIQWLKTYVNYNHVFCRFEGCTQVVGGVTCPYSHFNLLASTSCPKAEACWRQQVCPFMHQSSTNVHLIQTVSEDAWYTSTVQMQEQMKQGCITIRSRGALEHLTSNNYSELHTIFHRVLGSVPQFNFRTEQVTFRTAVTWLYLPQSGQMQEFDSKTSLQLESVFRSKGTVIIVDAYSSVYLNPMLRLYQNGSFEPVARLEKVHSTTDAGFLDVICAETYFNALFQEVHSLEVEIPIGRIVPGQILKDVCQDTGTSTRNDMLIGLATRLEFASSILAADKTEIFSQILSVEAPQNFPYSLVKYLADCCSVIIAGNYVYGRSSEMSSFLSMLSYNYSSVQCPPNLTPQDAQVLCQRYGLLYENGLIAGPAESVREAYASLQAQHAVAMVPDDVEEARLRSLPSHVPVRIVGRRLEGTPENVQQALNVLPRKQQSIRYPVNLPLATVQQVANKYNVRVSGQNLVGDQQSIMMTLNELNQMPVPSAAGGAGGFQFAPVPTWYSQQKAELQKETLSPNSDEFRRVADRFNKTMGDESTIVGIERVQNRRLYTNFAYKYEAFCKVENRSIEIKELFHGTSNTDPAVIFQSDTGLDSRLGKGLWGNGTYYAENSYYSHDYCYHTPQRKCQMFLCSVIVGDYKEMPQDQSMVRPPQKPNSTACYHSVKGKTETSDIWITYEAAMSYPTWLITYEAEDRQYDQLMLPPAIALMMLALMQAADDDEDN